MGHLVPYLDLTPTERDAIHQWLNQHGIDPHDVPMDATFTYHDTTSEWTVDRFLRNAAGRRYLDGDLPARETVTFEGANDMPWRTHTTTSGS